MLIETLIAGLLAQGCAPGVGANILTGIVTVESGGNPLVVRSNTSKRAYYFRTKDEAVATTRRLIAAGDVNIDIGLGQINYRNVGAREGQVNLTLGELFEPCKNLWAVSYLYKSFYASAVKTYPAHGTQTHIKLALSKYNTGCLWKRNSKCRTDGFINGYVAKVEAAAFGRRVARVSRPSMLHAAPAPSKPRNPWAGGFPGVQLQQQQKGTYILGASL